jgi:hypothetical protein
MSIDPRNIQDRFHSTLRKTVDEKLELRRGELEAGGLVPNSDAHYRFLCGYIQALKDVTEWCEDTERDQYGSPQGEDDARTFIAA